MEVSNIKEHLQQFFTENTITIIGSGLSCAEGIPGMGRLAEELINNVPGYINTESLEIWGKIENDLKNGMGLEETLLRYEANNDIEVAIKNITEKLIRKSESDVISRVVSKKEKLRISEYVKKLKISPDGTKIITTNYDRLIEFGCEFEGILVDNLFQGNYISKSNQNSKYSFFEGVDRSRGKHIKVKFRDHVTIYKPHGCLGWYKYENDVIYSSFNLDMENLIITPGSNKYRKGYDAPFDTNRARANEAICNANQFIIIGYGFNDDHLETHLISKIKSGTPTLIITHGITDKVKKLIEENEITAVYSYNKGVEKGTIVNIRGRENILNDCNIWDLGEFVKEVL
ncbi:Uncharacterised protein [[Clostridium] sordellii]|nr:SIR2 family protein [Paeniclostridium sordellii]CEO11984.1 Uncharacterised protein [[Clostridium] sordellii] [Paeniclostridium sordellii]